MQLPSKEVVQSFYLESDPEEDETKKVRVTVAQANTEDERIRSRVMAKWGRNEYGENETRFNPNDVLREEVWATLVSVENLYDGDDLVFPSKKIGDHQRVRYAMEYGDFCYYWGLLSLRMSNEFVGCVGIVNPQWMPGGEKK